MKLSDKIIQLRKANGWSQETLAEKLNVSRQAISRWEGATAQPDAANILQLSKLFGVTTDYLLNDAYERDNDPTSVTESKGDGVHRMMVFMITLEVMILLIQFAATIMMKSTLLSVLTCIPFVAVVGGFEYSYQKRKGEADENAQACRRKFYGISAWIGAYFPIRLVVSTLSTFYPRPYHAIALEGVIFIVYLMTATLICFRIGRESKKWEAFSLPLSLWLSSTLYHDRAAPFRFRDCIHPSTVL